MTKVPNKEKVNIERFHSSYQPEPNTGCWLWDKTIDRHKKRLRYGRFQVQSHPYLAHKIAWLMYRGEWVDRSMVVMHKCDTPQCVNPDHLRKGTSAENSRDMVLKNRSAKPQGEKHGASKFKTQDIHNMRVLFKEGLSLKELSEYYSVAKSTICRILKGRRWPHLFEEI